jgi:carbonic anhydrase/acetyltransferase-like protein (isoleucine patch superfamily)
MPIYKFEDKEPKIHPSAFIAPTAVLVGDVTVEEDASIWYNAVLRGDIAPIVVRKGANVQECAVLHGSPGHPIEIGPGTTIGHLCMVHGATVGAEVIVGNCSTVLDGAKIGDRALVAAGALVGPGTEVEAGVLTVGMPAKPRGPIAGTPAEQIVNLNPGAYQAMAKRHRDGIVEVHRPQGKLR